jgi:DNA-binding NtrC family response regulator
MGENSKRLGPTAARPHRATRAGPRFTSFSLIANDSAGQCDAAEPTLPDISDLSARIRFSPQEGQVWLDDQRVVLMNIDALIALRRELVESVGPRRAREILFRMGHAAGCREAMIALKVRADMPEIDAFLVGPQLHALRGEVRVEPVRIEADRATGRYFSELIWRNSAEAECHVACFGGSAEPVCWMALGYASGYTSTVMDRPILFRETACIACGDPTCRIVGRPAEEWPGDLDIVRMPRVELAPHSDQLADGLVGASPGFLGAWHLLKRVAPMDTTVLLLGETGVGKELFARALHSASGRAGRPMHAVNCAAIPETLIDAELFGVERGAYTGATHSRAGWFEAADKATLFLDEVGTLDLTAQAKLLRVIQEGRFNRVGSTTARVVDVRLICATNLDLDEQVEKGGFRADLLHRLNIFPIHIPPLRDRRDDIPHLLNYFLERFNRRTGRSVPGFTQAAVDGLLLFDFPGNIRQLENMIERAAILTPDEEPIELLHLFHGRQRLRRSFLTPVDSGSLAERQLEPGISPRPDPRPTDEVALSEMESRMIRKAMEAAQGNVSRAARTLGISRATLRYRLKRLALRDTDR